MARNWPDPVIVIQTSAQLPDGSPDPASSTDCGEACLASAVNTITGLQMSPGCIRQALGKSSSDGRTTGDDLARMWRAIGRRAMVRGGDIYKAVPHGVTLKHDGRYRALLGYWDGPSLHWVLAFENDLDSFKVMDPLQAQYRQMTLGELRANGTGDYVDFQ